MIVGTDGPVVAVPAAAAGEVLLALAPRLRQLRALAGPEWATTVEVLEELVEDLTAVAAAYERSLEEDAERWAMSAWGSASGHFRAGGGESGDGDAVNSPWLTSREAADVLGVGDRQIRRLAGAVLETQRPGRDLLFSRASVEAELARRRAS